MRRCSQNRARHARIGVVGVGGAGCKIIKRLTQRRYYFADFVGMDTDQSALSQLEDTPAIKRLLLGNRRDR